jgi:antitoxin (DNA-binding transcriptional repressor) of toxin-antitoxin stability system
MQKFQSSVGATSSEYATPDGAEILFWLWFYRDVAPTALGILAILHLDIILKGYYKVIIMNLIAIKDLKQPRRLKERLRAEKELLLTSDGRPVAVLVNVDNAEDPESILQSIRDSRSRLALSRIRETARRTGVSRFTPAQIDREIAAARKAHKTRR